MDGTKTILKGVSMNTKKITLSLFTAIALTSGLNATGGTLDLAGGNNKATTEFNLLNPGNNTGLLLDNIEYSSIVANPASVSDASFEFDFSETNITEANLQGTVIRVQDPDTNNTVTTSQVATFESMTSAKVAVYKKLNNDTGTVNTEKKYQITSDDNASAATLVTGISYSLNTNKEISLKVFSSSGNAQLRDEAKASVEAATTTPQFKFSCIAKFDALINFENNDTSFVATGHGHTNSENEDTLVFSIDNKNSGIANSAEGNATEIIISTDANFTALGYDNTLVRFYGKQGAVDYNGTGTIINHGSDINLTIDNAIPSGISKWYATLDGNSTATLSATKFFMSTINIEGNVSVQPQIDYTPNTNAGEWQNHAFIAQIPGATQTATTQTKLFIVNRSCAAVTPKFKLIKDGTVTMVDGASIAVDTQQKTTLASLITTANANGANLVDGRYAVEIILPGIAEDFYVYAQAQGISDKSITKDLPVYNTSVRD